MAGGEIDLTRADGALPSLIRSFANSSNRSSQDVDPRWTPFDVHGFEDSPIHSFRALRSEDCLKSQRASLLRA